MSQMQHVHHRAAQSSSVVSRPCQQHHASHAHPVPRPVADRRTLLSAVLLASITPALSAQANSSLCVEKDSAEAADECRRNILREDAGKGEDYGKVSSRTFSTVSGVAVADMGDAYTKDTVALYDSIMKYASMDPYDKQRPQLIKTLKSDAANWVSQYARGGSARKQSARKMYVAADAISGHLAANGYAPFPAYKFKKLQVNMDEAMISLSEGK